MHVLVVGAGSWGDVLPLIPPSLELVRRGHDVLVAVPPVFVRSLRRLGLRAQPTGPFLKKHRLAAFHAEVGGDLVGRTLLDAYWHDIVLADTAEIAKDLLALDQLPDVILAHYHSVAAYAMAQLLELPRVVIAWSPACLPSAGYGSPFEIMERLGSTHPAGELGGADDNLRSWAAAGSWAADRLDRQTNDVLRELGATTVERAPFGPLITSGTTLLLTSHRALLVDQHDWPANTHQVGYPYFDHVPGTGTNGTSEFLAAGPPPVLVSFGTAIAGGAGESYERVLRALDERGQRAIVLGSVRPHAHPDRTLHLEYAPVADLVRECAAMVHHGGPGITNAALRAGAPALVIPQFVDQPLSAALVAHAGAGVATAPAALSVDDVDALLDRLPELGEGAHRVGVQLREDPDAAESIANHVERVHA
jgi:UDP:flavonoid glycosyltransferase YjiC (YdhE family)